MRRLLVFVTLLLCVVVYFNTLTVYKEQISIARLDRPSNMDLGSNEIELEGRILSYNLDQESFIFKTLSPFTGKDIQYRISYKGTLDAHQFLQDEVYHVILKIDLYELPYKNPKNDTGYDYDYHLFAHGISGQHSLLSIKASNKHTHCTHCTRMRLRNKLAMQIDSNFSRDTSGLLKTMLLGDKTDFENYETFRKMGLAHIFAISGLHFGIIYQLFNRIFFFPIRWLKSFMIVGLMLLFLYWIGESYSAQRAFWIIAYQEYGKCKGKVLDPLSAIAFSSLMILAISPWAIHATSFQLSYYAYIIIVIFYKSWTFLPNERSKQITKATEFAIIIHILLIPATLYYFKEVNLLGFLANLIVVPLIGLLLPMGFLSIVVNCFGSLSFFNNMIEGISWFMNLLSIKLPVHMFAIHGYEVFLFRLILSTIFISILLKSIYIKRKVQLFLLIGLVCLSTIPEIHFHVLKKSPVIHFIDVGHGDFAFVQYGRHAIVIDTGDSYQDITRHLTEHGITQIDALIISHAHQDHIGGALNLLSSYIPNVLIGNNQALLKLNSHNYNREFLVEEPVSFVWNKMYFEVYPFRSDLDENDHALVVRLEYQGRIGYFLGDVSKEILSKFEFESNLEFVKISHHGSKTAYYEPLFTDSNLNYSIISHGRKYKMPNPEVESLAKENSNHFISTYINGGCSLFFTPNGVSHKTFLSDIQRPILYNKID